MATITHLPHAAAGQGSGLLSLLTGLYESWMRSRIFWSTYNELNSLGNRELADLGMNRSTILRQAYDAAYAEDV